MTLEKQTRPIMLTRSTEVPPGELAVVVTLGHYYAIRADSRDYEEGFCIAKVIKCHNNHFQGVYLEKSETTDAKLYFKESNNFGCFDLDTVISQLISALTVNRHIVEVEMDEINEILASTNVEI